jgi:hypothetical protein
LIWRQWLSLFLGVAIAFGFAQLWTSGHFAVSAAGIAVRGCQRVPAEAIYAASALDQQNIFLVRPAEVAARVSQVAGVATTTVHVRLPDQVIIDVQEYAPLVAWQVMTGTVWLASDGTPVPMVGVPPPLTLVDESGAAQDQDGGLRRQVLADLEVLYTARPDQSGIYYGALEGLYFRAPAGWTVYLGDGGPITAKLALLEAIEKDIVARNAQVDVIDLRFEGHALLK